MLSKDLVIKKIEKINNSEIQNIYEQIVDLLKDLTYNAATITNLNFLEKRFFRGSLVNGGDKSDFNNAQRLSYNPKPQNTTMGRANLPQKQIFYCSHKIDTVLSEINCPGKNNLAVVCEWKSTLRGPASDNFFNKIIAFGFPPEKEIIEAHITFPQKTSLWKDYKKKLITKINPDKTLEEIDTILEIDDLIEKFVFEHFSSSGSDRYIYSASVSNAFLYNKTNAQKGPSGICYPSVHNNELNFAFPPRIIDDKILTPVKAYKYINGKQVEIAKIDSNNWNIHWEKLF